jgi:hypothetical protein
MAERPMKKPIMWIEALHGGAGFFFIHWRNIFAKNKFKKQWQ